MRIGKRLNDLEQAVQPKEPPKIHVDWNETPEPANPSDITIDWDEIEESRK